MLYNNQLYLILLQLFMARGEHICAKSILDMETRFADSKTNTNEIVSQVIHNLFFLL
jgi:hypothetical protein